MCRMPPFVVEKRNKSARLAIPGGKNVARVCACVWVYVRHTGWPDPNAVYAHEALHYFFPVQVLSLNTPVVFIARWVSTDDARPSLQLAYDVHSFNYLLAHPIVGFKRKHHKTPPVRESNSTHGPWQAQALRKLSRIDRGLAMAI